MNSRVISHSSSRVQEHFFGIALLLAFLLPHSNTLFQMVNPLLCIVMVYAFTHRFYNSKVTYVIIPVVISLLINLQIAGQKALLSTFTILLYFACFPFVGKTKIRLGYLYICLAYIVVSQLIYLFDISFLVDFYDKTYPIGEDDIQYFNRMRDTINYGNILSFRLGGFYHNPNQCAKFLTILMAFFLVINTQKKSRGTLVFLIISYIGAILTGSRTGFIISSLILYFGFLKNENQTKWVKYLFVVFAVFGGLYIIATGAAVRGFDVENGMSGSAGAKWRTFLYYLNNESNVLSLLFGSVDPTLFEGQYGQTLPMFDSDYGEIVFRFGFVGFIGVIFFFWAMYKNIVPTKRFFLIMVLWMYTSTIIASYRGLFIFMLLLSVVYSNYHHISGGVIKRN